ncbi:MAG TPA: hypothetical protein VNR90_14820 [Vicinamibacterales bacterium]|nr:hypothetical protein [Vicinamibacterales bacterium]
MSSRALFWWAVAAAFVVGAVTAVHYAGLDLTLSHYDAKGHLVVARRIADSLRPGWWQIGAVWLPLPHLLNAGPVQIDAWYRSGFSGVAISVICFALAVGALVWLIHRATGSMAGAAAGAIVLASQADVLYLQSTPMTEPLLMALTLGGVALTWRWAAAGAGNPPTGASVLLGLACLTRYEAWPITAAAIGAAAIALVTSGTPAAVTVRRIARLSAWPIAAIIAFLILSRATIGSWFVTGGFFVADNPDYHRPFKSAGSVWWGMRMLNGNATVGLGVAGLVVLAWAICRDRAHRALLVTLALAGCAALPTYAFYQGHPFRIRYMVVLAMSLAATSGLGVGLLPRLQLPAAMLVAAAALIPTPATWGASRQPPWSSRAPMVLEAQWDRPHSIDRRAVRACLARDRRGEPILASMGSLAHLMQETSADGINLRDYIHEGIGQIWADSLEHPARHAGWVLIEEQAEGGDVLAARRREHPDFLTGFDRVCEGGGVALYRRR